MNPFNRSRDGRKILAGIIVLAFAVRVLGMVLLQAWIFPSEREFAYEEGEIAFALANGQGYSWPRTWRPVGPPNELIQRDRPVPTTWKAPVYPLITAAAFWFFGSYSPQAAIAMELLQVVESLLTCFVLFCLGKLLLNEWTGLLAALIFAIYPASIHFSVQKIEYGPLLALAGLFMMQQTIELSRRPGMSRSLTLGAICGIATLINPVILVFYPFGLLWLLMTCRSPWRSRLKYATAIIGCCAAVMTPWLVRNYLAFDRFVFIRPNFTQELVQSNYYKSDQRWIDQTSMAVVGDDARRVALYDQRAWSLIVEKPVILLRGISARVPQFWMYLGETQGRMRLANGAAYYFVLGMGLLGVWISRRQSEARLLILYLLTMPIPFYLTWAIKGRFRFPLEPVLILFTSYALVSLQPWLWRWLQRGRAMTV